MNSASSSRFYKRLLATSRGSEEEGKKITDDNLGMKKREKSKSFTCFAETPSHSDASIGVTEKRLSRKCFMRERLSRSSLPQMVLMVQMDRKKEKRVIMTLFCSNSLASL